MGAIRFIAMPTERARHYQGGGHDANGQTPEAHVSDGHGVPCQHCLTDVVAGDGFLVLAHRPFPQPQPYAEIGPIFVHAEACARYEHEHEVPPMILGRQRLLMRGYGADDRIVYGTGQILPTGELAEAARALLTRPDIAYIHVRSASNNCYQLRIERAP